MKKKKKQIPRGARNDTILRDAGSGRFLTDAQARRKNPNTWVRERGRKKR